MFPPENKPNVWTEWITQSPITISNPVTFGRTTTITINQSISGDYYITPVIHCVLPPLPNTNTKTENDNNKKNKNYYATTKHHNIKQSKATRKSVYKK